MAACPAGRPTLGRGRVSDFCFACCSWTCRGSGRPTLSTLHSDAVRLACHVHGVRPYVVGGRVMACRVVSLPRRPGGCLSCVLLTGVPWVGRGLRRTSVSFLDVAPPPPPCTHYTHWWPALRGWAGWVGSTGGDVHCVPALPTLQIGETMGGFFSPISQWNPGLFFSSFRKAVLSGQSASFLQTEIAGCGFHHWTPALAR